MYVRDCLYVQKRFWKLRRQTTINNEREAMRDMDQGGVDRLVCVCVCGGGKHGMSVPQSRRSAPIFSIISRSHSLRSNHRATAVNSDHAHTSPACVPLFLSCVHAPLCVRLQCVQLQCVLLQCVPLQCVPMRCMPPSVHAVRCGACRLTCRLGTGSPSSRRSEPAHNHAYLEHNKGHAKGQIGPAAHRTVLSQPERNKGGEGGTGAERRAGNETSRWHSRDCRHGSQISSGHSKSV